MLDRPNMSSSNSALNMKTVARTITTRTASRKYLNAPLPEDFVSLPVLQIPFFSFCVTLLLVTTSFCWLLTGCELSILDFLFLFFFFFSGLALSGCLAS